MVKSYKPFGAILCSDSQFLHDLFSAAVSSTLPLPMTYSWSYLNEIWRKYNLGIQLAGLERLAAFHWTDKVNASPSLEFLTVL